MSNGGLIHACGCGSEILKIAANLLHQIRTQGGRDEYFCLLRDEKILRRVAEVVVRAGKLRSTVWISDANNDRIPINFHGLTTKLFSDLDTGLPNGCRLATHQELYKFWSENPDLLKDEDDLVIIGGKEDGKYATVTKRGYEKKAIPDNATVENDFRFAIIIK